MNWNERYTNEPKPTPLDRFEGQAPINTPRPGTNLFDRFRRQPPTNPPRAPFGLHRCEQCGADKPFVKRRLQMRSDGSTTPFDICTDCIESGQ